LPARVHQVVGHFRVPALQAPDVALHAQVAVAETVLLDKVL